MNKYRDIYMHVIMLPGSPPLVKPATWGEGRGDCQNEGVEGTERGGSSISTGGGSFGCSINDHLVEVGKTPRPQGLSNLSLIYFDMKLQVKLNTYI